MTRLSSSSITMNPLVLRKILFHCRIDSVFTAHSKRSTSLDSRKRRFSRRLRALLGLVGVRGPLTVVLRSDVPSGSCLPSLGAPKHPFLSRFGPDLLVDGSVHLYPEVLCSTVLHGIFPGLVLYPTPTSTGISVPHKFFLRLRVLPRPISLCRSSSSLSSSLVIDLSYSG